MTDDWTPDDEEPIGFRVTEAGRRALRRSAAPRQDVLAFAEWLRSTHRYNLTTLAHLTGYDVGHLSRVFNDRIECTLECLAALQREAAHVLPQPPLNRKDVEDLVRELRASGRYDLEELARLSGYSREHIRKVLDGGRGSVACFDAVRLAAQQMQPEPDVRPDAHTMAAELARVLKRTGRYNVSRLARTTGRPRATITRVLNGRQAASVYLVEELAVAAGVDLAYLYPDRGDAIPEDLRALIS